MGLKPAALSVVFVVALVSPADALAQDPLSSQELPAQETEPEPAELESFWPGMWLMNSHDRPTIHLGPSDRSEAWSGLVAYLDHHDAGIRESAARWLEALGADAAPALAHLVRALDDDSVAVRAAAEKALGAIDPGWRERPHDELAELAAALPRKLRIEGTVLSFGSLLDPSRRVFPIQLDAGFGLEIRVEGWWGRPRPREIGVEIGEDVIFGIHSPSRFSVRYLEGKEGDEIRDQEIKLVFEPLPHDDGAWLFRLEETELIEYFSF